MKCTICLKEKEINYDFENPQYPNFEIKHIYYCKECMEFIARRYFFN